MRLVTNKRVILCCLLQRRSVGRIEWTLKQSHNRRRSARHTPFELKLTPGHFFFFIIIGFGRRLRRRALVTTVRSRTHNFHTIYIFIFMLLTHVYLLACYVIIRVCKEITKKSVGRSGPFSNPQYSAVCWQHVVAPDAEENGADGTYTGE
jgi:hypothetical protein